MTIRFYNQPHRFYAGGDLHARTLLLHILDDQGKSRFQQNLQANPVTFRHAIEAFRDGLVVLTRRHVSPGHEQLLELGDSPENGSGEVGQGAGW
jgi:hypothetical protein